MVFNTELHDAHVVELKEEIYSVISDASKDATGCRMRYDIREYTVAELWDLEDQWVRAAIEACNAEEAQLQRNITEWEEHIAEVMELCNVDRIAAIAIAVEPYVSYEVETFGQFDEGTVCWQLGLPYSYDWVRAERMKRGYRCYETI